MGKLRKKELLASVENSLRRVADALERLAAEGHDAVSELDGIRAVAKAAALDLTDLDGEGEAEAEQEPAG